MKNLTTKDQESEIESVSSNSLLARIFQNNSIHIDKIASYLALPKVYPDEYSLMW